MQIVYSLDMSTPDDPSPRYLACNGDALRELRLGLGRTQDDLARRSGYSRRLIQKAESGGSLAPNTLSVLSESLSTGEKLVQIADLVRTPLSIVEEFLAVISRCKTTTGAAAAYLISDVFVLWCAGNPNEVPFAGEWHGAQGLTRFFQIVFSMLEPGPSGLLQKTQFLTNGPVVSCWAESHAGVRGMAESPPPIWNNLRFEVRDGKIVRYDNLFDTQAGLEHLVEARARNLLDESWTPDELGQRIE